MMSREISAQSGGWDSDEENKGDEYVYDPNVDSSAKKVLTHPNFSLGTL